MNISTHVRISLLTFVLCVIAIGFGTPTVYAAKTANEQSQLIESLIAQLRELQAITESDAQTKTQATKSCAVVQNNTGFGFGITDASVNGDVTRVQKFLKEKGYLTASPSGYFGLLTKEAVQTFQINHDLAVSGYVGQPTYEKINEISCGEGIKKDTDAVKKVIDTSSPKLWLMRSMTGEQSGDEYIVKIYGKKLDLIKRIEYSGKLLTGEEGRIVTKKKDKITFVIDAADLAPQYSGNVTFTLFDKSGNEQEMSLYVVYDEDEIEPEMGMAELTSDIEYNNDKRSIYSTFDFEVENASSKYVIDVDVTIDCDKTLVGGYTQRCERFIFDLSQKAYDGYSRAKVNPYVKGGASFRFASSGDIHIHGYPDSQYTLGDYEYWPLPNSVTYTFTLRNSETGEEVWSKTYTDSSIAKG